jgi:hypothetical protein
MTSHIRSFASFCIFFLGTTVVFLTFILAFVGILVVLPIIIYWQTDILLNLEMLITGVNLPNEDWMLIFLVPLFILGLPALLSHYGGELMESQVEVYNILTQSIATPFGIIGWLLTVSLLVVFFYWTLWCVQKVLHLNSKTSSQYLALLTIIMGGVLLYK